MIPKTIHQIWFQGADKIKPNLVEYHNSWKTINPEYNVIVWDELKIDNLMQKQPDWIKSQYFSYSKMIQKIDYAKYVILYNYGGIYMDMDIKCVQPLNTLNELNKHSLILSKMPCHITQRLVGVMNGINYNTEIINNGTIMCSPKHDVLLHTLKEAIDKSSYKNPVNAIEIFVTTGPFCLTRGLSNANPNPKTYIVLDKTYFEACDIFELQEGCTHKPHSIGIHMFENAWISNTEKIFLKIYSFIMSNIWIIIICIIALSIMYKMQSITIGFFSGSARQEQSFLKRIFQSMNKY